MVKTKKQSTKHHEKKRHGLHHKHGKHYHKVYWPYIPGALALLMSFVLMWAQPFGGGGVLGYATDISRTSLLESTNQQRVKHGVPQLAQNQRLNQAAQAKAEDMARRNYWAHTSPDGVEPWSFIDKTGYSYEKAGENLAYGFTNSDKTVAGWMNSDSHRANLLDAHYLEVGFGLVNAPDYVGNGPETIVVALYAQPTNAPALAGVTDNGIPTVSTDSALAEAPTRNIAFIETLTGGNAPWAFFAVGIISGGATSLLLLRHGLKLRKLIKKGEDFILHHPLYDTALVLIITASIVLSKSEGFIR